MCWLKYLSVFRILKKHNPRKFEQIHRSVFKLYSLFVPNTQQTERFLLCTRPQFRILDYITEL